MKQKIVIKVCMCCDKCRSKAMALAAATGGVVDSVALDGKYRDEVVIVGEGVDSIKLTRALRKKVGHADLLHISEVIIKKDDEKPAAAVAAAPSNPPPPPQPVTIVCHHCHHVYYSCYWYCCH